MVALLYKNWLCLASASRVDQIYTLQACVPTNTIKVEPVDNGRGKTNREIFLNSPGIVNR